MLQAPGEIVAMKPQGDINLDHVTTYQILDWPEITTSIFNTSTDSYSVTSCITNTKFKFKSLKWFDFDGCLQEKEFKHNFTYKAESENPFDITTLEIFPIDLTPSDLRSRLVARGKRFWTCRERRLVSYKGWDCAKKRLFVRSFLLPII